MTTAPGLEGITIATWVYATLANDPTLQGLAGTNLALQESIHEGVAPADVPLDWWITFDVMEPQDVKVVGLTQVMSRVEFQVKATCAGASYAPVIPVYQAIHAALESKVNRTTTRGLVLTCGRVSGRQYPEKADGVDYRHLGGLYRAEVQ